MPEAHPARAQALLAAGVPKAARVSAGFASRITALDPAGWRLRAEVEAACGAMAYAEACRGFADTLTRAAGGGERFAAALGKLPKEEQGEFRLTVKVTLEEHPASAPLKELKAHLDRIAPAN
jgi:hypothetical protein